MIRDLRKQWASRFCPKVTIEYQTEKPGEKNSGWVIGIPNRYTNVPCLREIIGNVYFNDSNIGNALTSKNTFYIPFDNYDFRDNKKRSIQIIDNVGMIYPIDQVTPLISIGTIDNVRYLVWALYQK